MDRRSQLVNLTFRMNAASAGRDWTVLGRVDRELCALLPRLAAHGAWDALEGQALDHLRQAHRTALERCERESAAIGQRLAQMCANKEGWLAYAMAGSDELENPA
jgi:hypothetical protein